MRCSALRGVVLALALLSLPMLGCQIKTIQIQLPGFADGAVDGIFLWKQLPGSNGQLQWTRICRIDFTDLRFTQRGETLSYVQNCIDGKLKRGLVLPALVERQAGSPATVTVELYYLRYENPGTYRATAFNESGESPLSASSLPL
jgi:hypothetical protein